MVFNIDYVISVSGVEIGADNLANIKYSRSIGNKGFKGVLTSQFSFDFYLPAHPIEVTEGIEIKFISFPWFPIFYAANVNISGDIATVTAYDSCKNLDIPFDYSAYEQFDGKGTGTDNVKWYLTAGVVNDIAAQCGFSSSSENTNLRIQQLCYNDIAEKSCRQILEDLSAVSCGFWRVDSTNKLTFEAFRNPASTGSYTISEDDRTIITSQDYKLIKGLYACDELYGTSAFIRYDPGKNQNSWRYVEKISGRYITKEAAQEIADQIFGDGTGYEYRGWSVSAAEVNYIINPGDYILDPDSANYLPVLSVSYSFGTMMTASLSAPAPDNSYGTYTDYYSRQINERVTIGRLFGCASIDHNGLNLVSKNEAVVNNG